MSILTRNEIIKEIKRGNITIEPFDKGNVGPASVDLTLSNKFRVFEPSPKAFDVSNDADYKEITQLVERESIVIAPGDTVLGITKEKITIAPGLCGWLEGRSRFARLGLMVHISASFMQPGITNHQVLEITNMGHRPLRLNAGTKICQFVFEKAIGEAEYKGRFATQTEP